jgi:hypothetical protein
MEILKVRQQHELAVVRDLVRARSVRSELISTGCRPQEVRILDSEGAALARLADSPPFPEAVAGFIVGAVLTGVLAAIPQLAPIFDRGGILMIAFIAAGGLVGAIGSYLLAQANRPPIVGRELEDGEYAVIAHHAQTDRRAA